MQDVANSYPVTPKGPSCGDLCCLCMKPPCCVYGIMETFHRGSKGTLSFLSYEKYEGVSMVSGRYYLDF